MTEYKIAIFLTVHNRKNMTVRCLKQIDEAAQKSRYTCFLDFFVCDDNSSDGTAEALEEMNIPIHLVKGSGDLFWARGMAKAIESSEGWNGDFYLMVNDDVDFFPSMFDVLISSYELVNDKLCSIVGSTKDKETGDHTYGGLLWNGKGIREVRTPIFPQEPLVECNQTNWNCFFIPKKLYEIVGEIDSYYEHSYADIDYSNRIVKKGYKIFVASEYIGYCKRNKPDGTWRDKSLSVRKRIKALHKKTGLPPKSNWHYCKKFYGKEALISFLKPYFSIIKSGFTIKKSGKM